MEPTNSSPDMKTDNLSLQAENEKLRELDRVKTLFLSEASHDIANSAATLKACIDLMAPKMAHGEGGYVCDIVSDTVSQISRLAEDLIDWAAMERKTFRLKEESLDILKLAERVVKAFQLRAMVKKVEVRLIHEANLPRVEADGKRISQVLMNLLENSLRYTSSGGWVEVRLHLDGSQVRVCVQDSGIGMDTSKQKLLFECDRLGPGMEPEGRLGLGLMIAKAIVELHGGEIKAVSDGLGKGTAFHFTLPVLPDVSAVEMQVWPPVAAFAAPPL